MCAKACVCVCMCLFRRFAVALISLFDYPFCPDRRLAAYSILVDTSLAGKETRHRHTHTYSDMYVHVYVCLSLCISALGRLLLVRSLSVLVTFKPKRLYEFPTRFGSFCNACALHWPTVGKVFFFNTDFL